MTTKDKLVQAIKKARETSKKRGFSQSVDIIINFKDIDPKKTEQRISEEVVLPHGFGKHRKIGFFAEGELAKRARDAGADTVFSREDLEDLKDEKKAKQVADEHDSFLAQVDLMTSIAKQLGRILGPRGKMPKPVPPTADPKLIIERNRKLVSLRMKDQPTIQGTIGTESMSDEQLAGNAGAVLEAIEHKLPKGASQIRSVYVKLTMGKPVKVEA